MNMNSYKDHYQGLMKSFLDDNPGLGEKDYRLMELSHYKHRMALYERSINPLWTGLISNQKAPSEAEYLEDREIYEYLMSKQGDEIQLYVEYSNIFRQQYSDYIGNLDRLSASNERQGQRNMAEDDIQILDDLHFIGAIGFEEVFTSFLEHYKPESYWKTLLELVRSAGYVVIWQFQNPETPAEELPRQEFVNLIDNDDDLCLIKFLAERKAWVDWKGQNVSTIREIAIKHLGFMLEVDKDNKLKPLTEAEFYRLVDYLTYYFEKNFQIPDNIEPIAKVYTNKRNVLYSIQSLSKKIYPSQDVRINLAVLITKCFEEYRDDDIHTAIRASWYTMPANYPGST